MSDPKVSIVMAVYNGEPYLAEAVQSILNQSYTDFEFIIVDDGSTDSTWKTLTEFAERDARIVLLQNQLNLGVVRALNRGLEASRGELIARLVPSLGGSNQTGGFGRASLSLPKAPPIRQPYTRTAPGF